ncbi:tetratricopeptide repeat protein [Candidatus Marinimicrobia bacterium]|nr:tetratricopeptide repeat protein [Candidatus Neomarinimicrobiota bacterium]
MIGKSINKNIPNMFKYFYIILFFSMSMAVSQNGAGDTFFLDMGVVIQSENKGIALPDFSSPTPRLKSNNIVKTIESSSVYMATTSDMISSLDRITSQVTDIEKDFESKLDMLEIENFNLRNQITGLKKRLNAEILDASLIDVNLEKPQKESSLPYENITKNLEMNEVVAHSNDILTKRSVLQRFDFDIFTEGVIHYNNEKYYDCISSLSVLPVDDNSNKNASKTLFLLADSYENMGRYKQALNHLDRLSLANDDEYSDLILFKKGIIYRNIGMVIEAQKAFQELVESFPKSEFKIFAEEEIQNI